MSVNLGGHKNRRTGVWVWLAIGLLLAISVLTGRLGIWQLERAQQKRELAEQRQQAQIAAPKLIGSLQAGDLAASEGQRLHLTVQAQARQWYLDSRSYKGQAGMYVLQLMPLVPGQPNTEAAQNPQQASHVLLLRGWQPKDPRQAQGIQERGTIPTGSSLVVRVESERDHASSPLGLGSRVAGDHANHWLAVDTVVMSAMSNLKLAPFVLRQLGPATDAQGRVLDDGLIRDWTEPADGIQKHQAYALQWFLFCGLSVVLAGAVAIRLLRTPSQD